MASIRRAHGRRLAAFATWCREARLGTLAFRTFEQALAFDPENDEAREALGWKRSGGDWTPPDPRRAPPEGWPDDGEAKIDEAAKRETSLRSELVKELVAAADAARAKKAPPEDVQRLLWAVLAADPGHLVARRLLGHTERNAGGYAAPEDAPILAALSKHAEARAKIAALAVPTREASAEAKVDGWSQAIPLGAESPMRDRVYSLTDPGWTAPLAVWLWKGREHLLRMLDLAPKADAKAVPRLNVLHVGDRSLADALIDAQPGLSPQQRARAKSGTNLTLGGAYVLVVAESLSDAENAVVRIQVEGTMAAREGDRTGAEWLSSALAQVATRRLLGTYLGFAAEARRYAGDTGPVRSPEEPFDAFVRRLVATGAAPPLAELLAHPQADRPPREHALLGSFLEWLFLSDNPKAAKFVAAVGRGTATEAPARAEAALAEAGLPALAVLDESWRRYVIDTYPLVPSLAVRDAQGGAWKISKLQRANSFPVAQPLFAPLDRPVRGRLWVASQGFTCEVVEDGQGVRLHPLSGNAYRVVREEGVYPFKVPSEYGGGWVEMHVALARAPVGWTVRTADAMTGPIDGAPFTFLDVDIDGKYAGFDRDGYVLPGSDFVLPLRREIVVGAKAIEFRRIAPDGSEAAWRTRPLAAMGRDLEGLQRVNAWRLACGLPALGWDPVPSVGALLHAEYLARNFPAAIPDEEAGRQDKDKPGATPAGAQWAPTGIVLKASTPTAAVDRLLASLKPRVLLLDPDARLLAGAFAGGIAAFSTVGPEPGLPPSGFRGPVFFPAPNSKEIPVRAGPDVVALLALPDAGCPVTIQFRRGEDPQALAVDLTLSGPGGRPIALARPDPAAGRLVAPGCAVFVPKAPLAARVVHLATATFVRGGKKETRTWSFTTGGS